jgi:hypothetical protein
MIRLQPLPSCRGIVRRSIVSIFNKFLVYLVCLIGMAIASYMGAAMAPGIAHVDRAIGGEPQTHSFVTASGLEDPKQMDFCELMVNARELTGRNVKIEGEVRCSSEHDCILTTSKSLYVHGDEESQGVQHFMQEHCGRDPCSMRLMGQFVNDASNPQLWVYKIDAGP